MSTILDPTAERSPTIRPRLGRPDRLEGLTIGIVDISKPRGNIFLDQIDARLQERGIATRRYMKPTMTRPAPLPLRQQIGTEVQAVIQGLAD